MPLKFFCILSNSFPRLHRGWQSMSSVDTQRCHCHTRAHTHVNGLCEYLFKSTSLRNTASVSEGCILLHSGYYNKITINYVVYTQPTLISHSRRGWKSKIKEPAGSVSDEGLLPGSQTAPSLGVFTGQKAEGASRVSGLRGLCPLDLITSQRSRPLIPSHWRLI